jgi:hypothetical protein
MSESEFLNSRIRELECEVAFLRAEHAVMRVERDMARDTIARIVSQAGEPCEPVAAHIPPEDAETDRRRREVTSGLPPHAKCSNCDRFICHASKVLPYLVCADWVEAKKWIAAW